MNVMDVVAPWEAVNKALGLSAPIRDEAHYNALLGFVDECFERFGAQAHHPAFALVDLVAERIREYEARMHPWPDLPANELLRELMNEHGLTQKDLPDVGTQSVISNLLCGKRKINLRQARALSARFKLPVTAFIQ